MKIAIIGGGAAGMFCALSLANSNADVTIFEKNNDTLKKLLLTGHGRCNVTNLVEPDKFLENVPHNSKFMFASINKFDPFDLVDYLREKGVTTKLEKGNRVFPDTNKAITIKECFDNNLPENVTLKTGCEVKKIARSKDKFKVFFNSTSQSFDAVVVATGGLSFPKTGSTGDGYEFAKKFGLEVKPQRSSLCSIRLMNVPKHFEGTPFNCKVSLNHNNQTISLNGKGLFTGFGVSGPVIHKLSALVEDQGISCSYITFDLLNGKTYEQCVKEFKAYIKQNPKRFIVHLLSNFVNIKFAKDLLFALNLPEKLQCANVSNAQLQLVINALKSYSFEVLGFDDIGRATVTRGGVSCKEIVPATMESKAVKNLYFIGEVLDVDGFSGGFNLQIAFSTAYACATDLINKADGE